MGYVHWVRYAEVDTSRAVVDFGGLGRLKLHMAMTSVDYKDLYNPVNSSRIALFQAAY